MAAITFASTVTDVSAFLPGCPSLVIETTIRKIVTDLCSRARVWSVDLDAFNTVASTATYTLTSPYSYAEIMDPETVYLSVSGRRKDLAPATSASVRAAYPNYPLDDPAEPVLARYNVGGTLTLIPTPDAAYATTARVFLRPTRTATSWEGDLYNEFSRVVYHGVLFELMSMPGRSWTDGKLGIFHGKEWTFLLSQARDRALRGYQAGELRVDPIPFA